MDTYSQLTQIQRYQIYTLLKMGHWQSEIATSLGVHKSTISREIQRNLGKRGYQPKQAHQKALARRKKGNVRIHESDWHWIERLLKLDWSPGQISLYMNEEQLLQVSHEWIYQHIYQDRHMGGKLWEHLRGQKKRRKRYSSDEKRGQIPDRVWIDARPVEVTERQRPGDWEADTIISQGKQQAIVTLTERKSRLTLLKKVNDRTAQTVAQAMMDRLQPFAAQTLTITCDNGKEFTRHREIAQALQADVYFAHPQSAWERGSNENANGLIRQYFPRGTNFTDLTDAEISRVEMRLNHRPRKWLGLSSPYMVFFQEMRVALGT